MVWRKFLKVIFFAVVFCFAAIGVLGAFFAVKYYLADAPYERALSNPVSRDLMETCIQHQMFPAPSADERTLSDPLYADERIAQWLTVSLPDIEDFDSSNIQERMLDGEKYFTPDGWCRFIEAMSTSRLLDKLMLNKLKLSMTVDAPPVITHTSRADPASDLYQWTAEIKVSLKLKSTDPLIPDVLDMKDKTLVVTIARSSSETNPDRIGISSWTLTNVQ